MGSSIQYWLISVRAVPTYGCHNVCLTANQKCAIFQDVVCDVRARVPVDEESNSVLQEDPFGVYTALGTVALTEQVLLPRLQHIESVFMSSREIGTFVGYEVTDDDPNQCIRFTNIYVAHDDNSDAAGQLSFELPLFCVVPTLGVSKISSLVSQFKRAVKNSEIF